MIETQCQQLIVDAVIEVGGRALKFNNRFVSGICDLLGKMPGHPPWMLEAKLHNLSVKTQNHVWDVGCTKLQKDHLRDWHEAGFLTGVVSFIQTPGRETIQTLRMQIIPYDQISRARRGEEAWVVFQNDHRPLGGKDERMTNIRQQLIEFANG